MNYKIQKKNSSISISIDLNEDDVKGYISEAEKYLANNLKLRGFRPGKAPTGLAKKHLDSKQVFAQATDMAVRQSLVEVLIKEKLEILDGPKIEIIKNTSSELSFKAELIVFPEVILGEYTGLKVKREEVNVGQKEVDSTLEYIRSSMAKLEKTNEPAKIGDRVEVDFHISESGKLIDGGESHNHPLVLGETKLLPGVEKEILGASEGEVKKFSVTAPEDYQDRRISGKKLDFEIKLESVHKIVKPELDNEFLKKLGSFQNVDDLKNSIREGIKTEKEGKEKEKMRIDLLNQVAANSKVEVPEILVNRQLDKMLAEFDADLHRQGMEMSLYLAHIKKTPDDLKNQWRPDALKTVTAILILREFAKKEKITVSEEEVKEKINEILLRYAGIKQAQDQIDLDVLRKNIEQNLINEKVLSFLESKAEKQKPR